MRIEIPQLPGRDLVHSDKKRREAQTKGQVAKIGNLLFCLGLHRLFAHRYYVPAFIQTPANHAITQRSNMGLQV